MVQVHAHADLEPVGGRSGPGVVGYCGHSIRVQLAPDVGVAESDRPFYAIADGSEAVAYKQVPFNLEPFAVQRGT
jgi:hypothetical protein